MDADHTIYQLIEWHATRSPEAVAVVAPGRSPLTYGGLLRQIKSAVSFFHSVDIGRNDPLAIVLPNGPEMATAFLSSACGAAAAPLNPSYKADEFDFYLSDLGAKALIVQAGLASAAREVAQARKIPVIELIPCLQAEAGLFELTGQASGRKSRQPYAQSDDIALVLHTSGTTSRPKIVPLTQSNLCASANNIRRTLQLVESDRCLNVMPLFHVHGLIGSVLSSIASGASVVCPPRFDDSRFLEWLQLFCPTWYTAVPTIHQAILERAGSDREISTRCSLRLIRSSSASLSPNVMSQLEGVFKVPVIEAYGMTEGAHQLTSNLLPPGLRKAGSVGVATGTEVAIMGAKDDLLPAGEIGEIVVRGANVTRAYMNNPTANQSAFADGWFRTGDQGYVDCDGYLFITGRIKEIINRGGEKIAPREVDEVLLGHPAVKQAVTFAAPHETLGEDVVTAIELRRHATATEGQLREFAFSHLVDHKVPSQIVIVDRIPTGPTGKLQRIGLAKKLGDKLTAKFGLPRSSVEAVLTNIWADVLGIERVGIYDNFFRSGGDSLHAIQLVAEIRAAFQVDLPPNAIFVKPTVAEQALVLEDILLKGIETLSEKEDYQHVE